MAFTGLFKVNSSRRKKKTVDTKDYVLIGENGSYFEDLDAAYLSSPTATMALLKFHEFCVPTGLLDNYQKLWKKVENDFIRYGYYVLNVTYNVDGIVDKEEIIYRNAKHYVVKDEDDNGNASTFKNIKTGAIYPAFNSNPEIVKAQILATEGGFKKYKGQIYMYNDSSLPYRITPLYSVLDWMKTERNSSTYVSKACDNAMFGNNIFVMKKSSDATAKEIEIIDTVKEALAGVKGVDEAAQNLLLEWDGDIDDVPKLMQKLSISNDVNVDLLNATDDKAESKICTACYGFPRILISQSEGIFGNSGEAITVATELWAKTCQREATNILDGFKEIGFNILKTDPTDGSTIDPDNIGA